MEIVIYLLLVLAGTEIFWTIVGAVFNYIFRGISFIFKGIGRVIRIGYRTSFIGLSFMIQFIRRRVIPYSGILCLLFIPLLQVITWFISQDYQWLAPILFGGALIILSIQASVNKKR